MKSNEDIIRELKHYIINDMDDYLEECYIQILENKSLNLEYIFQKVFLFGCLHQKEQFIKDLFEMYKNFDPVSQAGLRPTIIYGKYIYKGGKDNYPITVPKL